MTALWLAVGLRFALDRLCRGRAPGSRQAAWTRRAVAAAAGLAVTTWSVRTNWTANDRSRSEMVERRAEVMFRTLPRNTIVVAFGNLEVAPLGYFRHIEQRRPDITLISLQGIAFANRLYSPFE